MTEINEIHKASETNLGECCDCAEKVRALEEQIDLLNIQLEVAKAELQRLSWLVGQDDAEGISKLLEAMK